MSYIGDGEHFIVRHDNDVTPPKQRWCTVNRVVLGGWISKSEFGIV